MTNTRTTKLALMGILAALAYIVMVVGRIPVVLFLKYDPKDVIITIGGFIFGPLSAFTLSLLVSLVEMFTVSDTGPIGLIMNVLGTCAFACTASYIYKRWHTMQGAAVGLVSGVVLMTGVMLLWNYFITPLYMGLPREAVAELLLPAFLPFNLVKGGLNAALTMLLYKPIVRALRRSNLLPASSNASPQAGKVNVGAMLVSGLVLVSCIVFVLILRGVI